MEKSMHLAVDYPDTTKTASILGRPLAMKTFWRVRNLWNRASV